VSKLLAGALDIANMAYRQESSHKSLLPDSDAYQLGKYYSREGLVPSAKPAGPRGRKMYRPNTTWTWAFMISTFIQAVIVLAIEA